MLRSANIYIHIYVYIYIYIYVPEGELGMAVSSSWYRGCELLTSPGIASNSGWSRHMRATAAPASSDGALSNDGILSKSIPVRKHISKETCIHQKRPTIETHSSPNRHLQPDTSVSGNICQKRPVYIKRHLQKRPTPFKSAPATKHICVRKTTCVKRDLYTSNRPTKKTHSLQMGTCNQTYLSGKQRMSKETCIHQKRPTKETHSLRTAPATQHICVRKTSYVKRDLYTSKETYKRDPLLSKSAPADKYICFRKIKRFQRTSGSFCGIQGLLRNLGPSLNNSLLLGGEYRADKLLPSRSALWGGYGQ